MQTLYDTKIIKTKFVFTSMYVFVFVTSTKMFMKIGRRKVTPPPPKKISVYPLPLYMTVVTTMDALSVGSWKMFYKGKSVTFKK